MSQSNSCSKSIVQKFSGVFITDGGWLNNGTVGVGGVLSSLRLTSVTIFTITLRKFMIFDMSILTRFLCMNFLTITHRAFHGKLHTAPRFGFSFLSAPTYAS